MTKPVIKSVDFMTLPAVTSDGSSLTQDCTEYGISQQNSMQTINKFYASIRTINFLCSACM